jgi:hypothetical protein
MKTKLWYLEKRCEFLEEELKKYKTKLSQEKIRNTKSDNSTKEITIESTENYTFVIKELVDRIMEIFDRAIDESESLSIRRYIRIKTDFYDINMKNDFRPYLPLNMIPEENQKWRYFEDVAKVLRQIYLQRGWEGFVIYQNQTGNGSYGPEIVIELYLDVEQVPYHLRI